MQAKLSEVVSGPVVDRAVITLNDGSDMINCFIVDTEGCQTLLERGCMLIRTCTLNRTNMVCLTILIYPQCMYICNLYVVILTFVKE